MVLVLPPIIGTTGATNLTAAVLDGTIIAASDSTHTKGTYTTIIATTTKPSYGIWVRLKEVGAANTNTSQLVDIAYGDSPSGGNEQILINNLDAGAAGNPAAHLGKLFYFPIYIPSGVSIRARNQGAIESDTCRVAVRLMQDPAYSWAAGAVTTYGANTAASNGTSVTPGSGSFGTWTQIGTADADPLTPKRFWLPGYSLGTDTTVASNLGVIELGTGPDAPNVSVLGQWDFIQTNAEEISHSFYPVYGVVNTGQELWARIAAGEAEARRIVVYGID